MKSVKGIFLAGFLLVGVLALALAAALPSSAQAAACPTPITTGTVLTADCDGSIDITADGVTLDCAGYTITGAGAGSGILLDGRTGVTVKNCNVTGFSFGIVLQDSSGNTLSDNTTNVNVRLPYR